MVLPLALLVTGGATLLIAAGNSDGGRDPGNCGATRDHRLMVDKWSAPRPERVVG